jgi:hypothetical protein
MSFWICVFFFKLQYMLHQFASHLSLIKLEFKFKSMYLIKIKKFEFNLF